MQVLDPEQLYKTRKNRADYRHCRLDIAVRKQVWREKYKPKILEAQQALRDAAEAMKNNPSPENSAAYIRARLELNKLYKLSAQLWS